MLKNNITGTLGGQICAYWRAASNSTQSVAEIAENTEVLLMEDNAGESLPESYEIVIVAPYLFSYCEEHAQNEDYKIIFSK